MFPSGPINYIKLYITYNTSLGPSTVLDPCFNSLPKKPII